MSDQKSRAELENDVIEAARAFLKEPWTLEIGEQLSRAVHALDEPVKPMTLEERADRLWDNRMREGGIRAAFLREAREIAIEALGEARRAIHDSRDMFPGSGRGTESAVEAIDRLIAQKRSAR